VKTKTKILFIVLLVLLLAGCEENLYQGDGDWGDDDPEWWETAYLSPVIGWAILLTMCFAMPLDDLWREGTSWLARLYISRL
jgi:hypothetical protein